jgi:hypothetical protein
MCPELSWRLSKPEMAIRKFFPFTPRLNQIISCGKTDSGPFIFKINI